VLSPASLKTSSARHSLLCRLANYSSSCSNLIFLLSQRQPHGCLPMSWWIWSDDDSDREKSWRDILCVTKQALTIEVLPNVSNELRAVEHRAIPVTVAISPLRKLASRPMHGTDNSSEFSTCVEDRQALLSDPSSSARGGDGCSSRRWLMCTR
jgi:hypothetical protein